MTQKRAEKQLAAQRCLGWPEDKGLYRSLPASTQQAFCVARESHSNGGQGSHVDPCRERLRAAVGTFAACGEAPDLFGLYVCRVIVHGLMFQASQLQGQPTDTSPWIEEMAAL